MHTTMMQVLPLHTIEDLYPRYAEAWELLVREASARHLLTQDEFTEQMLDDRLEKHVVVDAEDRVVAMTTLTTDLDAIDWVNPTFYQNRFPEQHADDTLFYLGYTFVDVDHRCSDALRLMAEAVNNRLTQACGVIGFDVCAFGMERGIGRRLERMFYQSTDIIRKDAQTYFVADYRHPAGVSPAASYVTTTLGAREDLLDEVRALLAEQWPSYTLIGNAGHGVDLERLLLDLPDDQVLLLDPRGVLCGVSFSVPMAWDGNPDTLPAGWDDAIVSGQALQASGGQPNTLCMLSVTVSARRTRHGLAERMIEAMKLRAVEVGAHSLITPLRPTHKPRYPLIPLEDYICWTGPDGQASDPWLRLHLRLGAEVLGIAQESMVVTGTVSEWESWIGTPLPSTGDYVIEGGLVPLQVDRTTDLGRYVEPNVWVGYRINDDRHS